MGVLDWMAAELRAAGIAVVEYPGWRTRAASGSFAPRGVMWHHDASAVGPSPNMARLIAEQGNGLTPPPLSQVWVDTAGTWHLLASGRANHAGTGGGWGRIRPDLGNADSIGIETDHTVGETWPTVQVNSLRRGTRVLLDHLGADVNDSLCGHKEYAAGRKIDPDGMNMNVERQLVATIDPKEDELPTPNDVWMAPCTGKDAAGQTQTHPAVAWLTVMAFRIAAIEQATAELTDRDPVDVDEAAVVADLAPMLVEALAGQLQNLSDADVDRVTEAITRTLPDAVKQKLAEALSGGTTA